MVIFSQMCGGLNEKQPHRLRCLNSWAPVAGAIVGGLGGAALLEEATAGGFVTIQAHPPCCMSVVRV